MLTASTAHAFDSIDYFGHTIRLQREYSTFEQYEFDSAPRFSAAELARIEEVISNVPFGPMFADNGEFVAAVVKIRFPGYGYSLANQLHSNPSEGLELFALEIPESPRSRYLVLEKGPDGKLVVIADVVSAVIATRMRRRNGVLELVSPWGHVVQRLRGK